MGWRPVTELTHDMAVHAILVPGGEQGRILYFGGYDVFDTHLYDVADRANTKTYATGESPEGISPNPHSFDTRRYDLFCCGHAFLADGRVLCAGGELNRNSKTGLAGEEDAEDAGGLHHQHGGMQYGGERQCAIYHPLSGKWTMAKIMHRDPSGTPYSGGRWYPTLATLGNGEVLCVGGHPDRNESYVRNGLRRHSNNTPERYNPTGDHWTLLASDPPSDDQITAPFGEVADVGFKYDYQRTHVLPDGSVFFASEVRGKNRFYDPYVGRFHDAADRIVDLPADDRYRGISATYASVMLPLLPGEQYRPRVMLFGGHVSYRIDLEAGSPAWAETPVRDWGTEHDDAPERQWSVPVLLPTGEVFFTGGTTGGTSDQELTDNCVLQAEIYDAGIDWNAGAYEPGTGSWQTQSPASASTVPRWYHSTALLMPDGAVWTAGSNGPDVNATGGEKQIEIFEPWYFDDDHQEDRPDITAAPGNVSYAHGLEVDVELHAGSSVERVAFTRCGSCTHGFNPDQRYLAANFQVEGQLPSGAVRLNVFAPPNGNIAPPGYYLLWVIDDAGRPCKVAPFIRISEQKCYVTEDISTYSIHEVEAMGLPAVFADACYVVFDAFLPDEVVEPTIEFRTLEGESTSGLHAGFGPVIHEGGAQEKDVGQRIVYPVHITFTSTDAFDLIPDDEDFADIVMRVRMTHAVCEARLTLSLQPNPRMRDGHPHWLSTDVRVFRLTPGESTPFTAGVIHPPAGANAPFEFIEDLIDAYHDWTPQGPDDLHPFEHVPAGLESNVPALYAEDDDGDRIYNYAVARVRYVAPDTVHAVGVSLFFRLWTTGWTALQYTDPENEDKGSYRRHDDGAAARPLLGIDGGEINNVPCFAAPRAADMKDQADPLNWNRTIKGTGAEALRFFGCWLDNNDDTPRFPLEPGSGTAFSGDLLSIQELTRGAHQCLVAEIHYPPDPIPFFATPSSTDDLAQRNILFDAVDNPGGFASHIAHHTLEIKASPHALPLQAAFGAVSTAATQRLHPDELAFHWGSLPRDSHVTLYVPQWDVDEVLRYAAQRTAPGTLSRAGEHAIQIRVTGAGFVPIPGPSARNVPALLSIQLPPSITKGDRYSLVVRQVDGRRTRVVGTTQFNILVRTTDEIRPELVRRYSVLRHISLSIPATNRWWPVFDRYLAELADRLRAAGVDPDDVEPSPDGSGEGKTPEPCDDEGPDRGRKGLLLRGDGIAGKVERLIYDCHGDFRGFVLGRCPGERVFLSREEAIETLAHEACCARLRVIVVPHPEDGCSVLRLEIGC